MKSRSFHEILEEKMDIPIENDQLNVDPKTIHSLESTLDPAHMAFLLGKINKASPAQPKVGQIYKVIPRAFTPQRRGVNHTFSKQHQDSYDLLKKYQAFLPIDFNHKELKSAFRKLALAYHPDQTQGHAADYQMIKSAYETLNTLFSKHP